MSCAVISLYQQLKFSCVSYVRDVNESVEYREHHAELTVAELKYFDEYKRRQTLQDQQFQYTYW